GLKLFKMSKSLPGSSGGNVALPKFLGGLSHDVYDPDLLPRCTGGLNTRPDPAGNRSLIEHLHQRSDGRRFALSAALKAERLAQRDILRLVFLPSRRQGPDPDPRHA